MPPGIQNSYWFQVFNTVSWQIAQGLPVLLFFKFMGASDTVLGITAALNPLMNLLQIPAASHVERIGYRSFVLRGWSLRTLFIGILMLAPLLLGFLDAATCMIYTLFCLFGYSTLRGISSCGFLPWMTQLVPEKIRGAFISRDQMYASVAGLATMLGASLLFYLEKSRLAFLLAFFISFACGLASLVFLRRMPDAPVPPSSRNPEAVPWRAMLLFPPFLRLLQFHVVFVSAMAAAGAFWFAPMRDNFGWSNTIITLFAVPNAVISTFSLWFFGRMIDRFGSRPLLTFAGIMGAFHLALWFLVNARAVPVGGLMILLLSLSSGTAWATFGLANTRLVMATVPEMGRSHFFALYSVISSLTLGLVPILWGLALDALRNWHWQLGPFDLNNYSLMFFWLAATLVFSQFLRVRLSEPRALTSEEFFQELLVHTPARAMTRLLMRKQQPGTGP